MSLTVSLFKKQGLPGYGSIGAACGVEIELDEALLEQDLEGFQQQVREAYVACIQAVNDELAHHRTQPGPAAASSHQERASGYGSSASPGNGNGHGNGSGRRASDKQLNYARQLAGQIRELGVRRLENICQHMYAKPLADLTTLDASGLIDTLKEIKSGSIDLDDALSGAAS